LTFLILYILILTTFKLFSITYSFYILNMDSESYLLDLKEYLEEYVEETTENSRESTEIEEVKIYN